MKKLFKYSHAIAVHTKRGYLTLFLKITVSIIIYLNLLALRDSSRSCAALKKLMHSSSVDVSARTQKSQRNEREKFSNPTKFLFKRVI